MEEPVLAFPDFQKDFHLRTDASDSALGAALEQIQNGKPVAIDFASRTLGVAERN